MFTCILTYVIVKPHPKGLIVMGFIAMGLITMGLTLIM